MARGWRVPYSVHMIDDPFAAVTDAARAAERAEKAYRKALDARDEAILSAIKQGISMASIGRTAGVSRNQVFNISRGTRVSPPGSKGLRTV